MISNALIKHIRALHLAKFRDEYKQFIAEGVKVVGEFLNSDYKPLYLCASCEWIAEYASMYKLAGLEVTTVSDEKLERISTLTKPNQVLAVFQKPEPQALPELRKDDLMIVLDGLRDPGNLGSIIRIADWFGVDHVICSEDTVDTYNPKTVQASMGSIVRVKVHYTELETLLKERATDVPVMLTALQGENIYTSDLPPGGLLVIGSESHGISEALFKHASHKIQIPPYDPDRHAESLNASIATAIACAELRRRNL